MWTKGQLVTEALGEIGIQGYEFDTQPDEMQTALRRLDTLMATWDARGVRVGYAFPSTPDDTDPSTPSGLPDSAVEAAYLALAISLAPGYGKQISVETRRRARETYQTLLVPVANPRRQQMPDTLPRGAGNRSSVVRRSAFFPPPCNDPLPVEHGDMTVLPE